MSAQGHCAQVWDQGSCANTRCDISALPIGFLVAEKSRAEPNWDLMLVLRELVGQRCRAELRSAGPYRWDGMEWDWLRLNDTNDEAVKIDGVECGRVQTYF